LVTTKQFVTACQQFVASRLTKAWAPAMHMNEGQDRFDRPAERQDSETGQLLLAVVGVRSSG
jgi:hypothetical protein